ncbi:MAG: hypothetical protein LRY73_19495 [Bacillus sp. (in: Bacteria)]|nr:hypothetical protein [Bacillus sp. (in: firmicutes)]
MLEGMMLKSRLFSENLSKLISKSALIDNLFSDMFYGILQFFRPRKKEERGSPRWCEIQKNLGYCHQPYGKFCSEECMGYGKLTTKCPQGYQPSHAWDYPYTGCWCDTFNGRNVICCDCTPITNSPYRISKADCGCMHYMD